MKLLYVVLSVAATAQRPTYYGRLGEFCGRADNGDFHACHGDLTCHGQKCIKGYAGYATGHLRGYGRYQRPTPAFGRVAPQVPSSYHPFMSPAVMSASAWMSVKPEDYTAEGQPCSPINGLGAGQKPCAPWLACYKHISTGLFARAYGNYGAAQSAVCKPKMVHLGQRCGRSKSSHTYINVGRCPQWSHCQPDPLRVDPIVGGPGLLGEGICTQTPIERLEDFVDPFHSSLT
eukprot:s3743_g3.t1